MGCIQTNIKQILEYGPGTSFRTAKRISLVSERRLRGHKHKQVNALLSRCSVTRKFHAVRKLVPALNNKKSIHKKMHNHIILFLISYFQLGESLKFDVLMNMNILNNQIIPAHSRKILI